MLYAMTAPGFASPRVLVVDDEESLRELVSTALRYDGFEVATAADGRSALKAAESFAPDAVILDVMLPDFDGFEVLRRLTAEGIRVPVLFLTARDATTDRVRGLTLGGDDYVVKPFSITELIARVRAVLRRSRRAEPAPVLTFADLVIDQDAHEVRRGPRRVEMTPTEFRLLSYLCANAGRVLTRAQILDHVWPYEFDGDVNIVETYVSYLRRKLDPLGSPLIHTVRGIGYVLRSPD
jgi:two-component system OmpR family response regulator